MTLYGHPVIALPVIDNRRFLVWSAAFIVLAWAVGIALLYWSNLLRPSEKIGNLYMYILGQPSALIAIGVFVDGLRKVFEERDYIWLWAFVLLSFGGAYMYGFLVASKEHPD